MTIVQVLLRARRRHGNMQDDDGGPMFLLRLLLYVGDSIISGDIGGEYILPYSTVSATCLAIWGIRGVSRSTAQVFLMFRT